MALTTAQRDAVAGEANTNGITPAVVLDIVRKADPDIKRSLVTFLEEIGLDGHYRSDGNDHDTSSNGGGTIDDPSVV